MITAVRIYKWASMVAPRLLFVFILSACSDGGGGNGGSGSTGSNPPPVGTSAPALVPVVQSELSDTLISCIEFPGCTLNRLPLIAMETNSPDVDDIMRRVLVSHTWMGVRFREILERMPTEMLLLFRGLTGVVISFDIRPSHYASSTGAIYLDPEGMWLTAAEQAVIDTTPDFRSNFGNDLQFVRLWRYVQGNSSIFALERDINSITLRTAALLFHELAHANDFFSPARIETISTTIPINATLPGFPYIGLESSSLISTYPTMSETMRQLARVSFHGDDAMQALRLLMPDDVAAEFSVDVANDYYNYTTQFEDLAMLFEEAMMYYSFGISRELAITTSPDSDFCEAYEVAWGQRNRIADPAVQVRALMAIEALLPEVVDQVEDRLAELAAPIQLTVGLDWCSSIFVGSSNSRALSNPVRTATTVQKLIPYQ
jgi:hypothetical protein